MHPSPGLVVKVYFNLHRNCFSVVHDVRVGYHVGHIALENATFHVQPAGRARVVATGHKNVHAYIKGTVVPYVDLQDARSVIYNPFKFSAFMRVDGGDFIPIDRAARCNLEGRRVWVGD